MKQLWSTLRLRVTRTRRSVPKPSPKRMAYLNHKEAARTLLVPLIESEAVRIGVTYGRVAIKDTKRSWGSCSAKGNLNFHYKLQFLPVHLARYVVIHELCHRKHLNHSEAFWAEVSLWCEDVPGCRRELRHIERHIGMAREKLVAYRQHYEVVSTVITASVILTTS
jgi:predicted metal-dependent hydrolase